MQDGLRDLPKKVLLFQGFQKRGIGGGGNFEDEINEISSYDIVI